MKKFIIACCFLTISLFDNIETQERIGKTVIIDGKEIAIEILGYIFEYDKYIEELIIQNFDTIIIPDNIMELKNLRRVEFSYNKNLDLKYIFTQLSKNSSINYLRLALNGIDSIPKEISLMSSLTELDMRQEKKISYFSEEAALITNITNLDIGDYDLLSLPKNLEKYESIETLGLTQIYNFDFEETFKRLSKMKNLKELWFTDFKTEAIVKYVPILENIQILHITDLELEELPPDFLNMRSLKCLDISYSDVTRLNKMYFNTERKLTIYILKDQEILDAIKKDLKNSNIKLFRIFGIQWENCY